MRLFHVTCHKIPLNLFCCLSDLLTLYDLTVNCFRTFAINLSFNLNFIKGLIEILTSY